MKRLLSAALILICIISLLPFPTNAQEEFPEWDFSTDTHVLSSTSGNVIYCHTATKDETIAFEVPYGKASIYLTYRNAGGEDVPSLSNIQFMKNDTILYILEFKTGYEYILNFSLASDQKNITVKTFSWNDSMFPTAEPGQTKSVTISPEKSVSFIATVPTSGLYTVSMGHKDFDANVSSYPDISTHEYPSPVSLGYCQENEKYQYCYYLEAGVKYHLEIFCYGETDVTGNFTFKQGAPNDDYGIIKNGETKTLTIEPHDNDNMKFKTFVFKAEHDGKHCLFSKTFSGNLRDIWGQPPERGETFQDANLDQGWVYELKKGEYYVISVHNYTDTLKTDSISLTHYTDYKSGELKILSHSEDMISVGLFTDPPCAAYDGIKWSCSDPNLFEIKEFGASVELYPKKSGTAQITAKVGSLTKTITVSTTYTPPALQEGKTEFIPKASQSDPCAFFTPTVSGTYTLSINPYISYSDGKMRVMVQKPSGGLAYDNYEINSDTVAEMVLEAGVKYTIFIAWDKADLRFDLKSAATAPTDPTEPEDNQPSDDPTEPSIGTTEPPVGPGQDNPSDDPTQGATAPSEDDPVTQPSQGSDDPSEKPTDPKEETKPNGSAGNDATDPGKDDPMPDQIPVEDIEIEQDTAFLTGDILTQIIENTPGKELMLDLTKQENVASVNLDTDALTAVADADRALSVQFANNIQLYLSQDILHSLSKETDGTDLVLTVQTVDTKALNEAQQASIQEMKVYTVVNVDLSCSGKPVHMLGGKAQIIIPLPDGSDGDWQVYYVSEDGKLEQMPIESIEKDHVVISTDHFSSFALVKSTQAENGSNTGWIIPVILLVVAAGGTAAVLILKKKGLLHFPIKK